MELLTDSKTYEKHFLRLLDKYQKYYWLSAWAGVKSKSFEKLIANRMKIEKIIVGIHFYQTHPDFIETFLDAKKVKFIKQPDGTFHPKMFLFFNSRNDWEIIVGSANFTSTAFTINTEVSVLINAGDADSSEILTRALNVIDSAWDEAKRFDEKELGAYRKAWMNHRPKINSLSGRYGKQSSGQSTESKPIYTVPVASMDWREFMERVYNEKYHPLTTRIKVLETAKRLFGKTESFGNLSDDERKFIAGIPNSLSVDEDVNWAYFGSMKGAGKYKNRIIQNDKNISAALDEIPFSGQITKAHYFRFLVHFKKAFSGNYLATSTRLLAMKRPDIFICLDSKNKSALCQAFGIKPTGLDYDRYWDEIIERIYDSQWWQVPSPKDMIERKVSDFRAAFLDSLYYKE